MSNDPDIEVAIQLVLSLGRSGAENGAEIIGRVLEKHPGNEALSAITRNYRAQIEEANKHRQENRFLTMGRTNYKTICIACHAENGKGTAVAGTGMTLGAPLVRSHRVVGKKNIPIRIMLKGMIGELDGRKFPGPMLPLESYDDEWIASVLTYVRKSWGNNGSLVTPAEVAAVRAATKGRKEMWKSSEILAMAPVANTQMKKWKFTASHHPEECKSAIDNDIKSRWSSGTTQKPGMWFAFDMGNEMELTSIVLDSSQSAFDYPREYSVETSKDGEQWSKPVVKGKGENAILEIVLPPTKTRHVRISQHGHSSGKHWSIHQLEVYAQ